MTTTPRDRDLMEKFDRHYGSASSILFDYAASPRNVSVVDATVALAHATLANACANQGYNYEDDRVISVDPNLGQRVHDQAMSYWVEREGTSTSISGPPADAVFISRELLEEIQTCLMLTAARLRHSESENAQDFYFPGINGVGTLRELGSRLGIILHPAD